MTHVPSLNNPQCIATPTVSYSEYSPVFRNPQDGSGGEDNHGVGAGAPLEPLEQLEIIEAKYEQNVERLRLEQAEIKAVISNWRNRYWDE